MVSLAQFSALVGQDIGVSDWITIDQAMINAFADTTGDHQFVHVDPERARKTPFGGTIAHGFLTLSLYALLRNRSNVPEVDTKTLGINVGGNKVRFLAPVRSGARVRGRFLLRAFEQKAPDRWQEVIEFTVEIEGSDRPALVAEWLTQIVVELR
jgi:acyl dehydratase